MRIILLKDVKGVGKRFEEKEVPNGYAANYLIPKQLAKYASAQNLKELEDTRNQKERSAVQDLEKLEEKLKNLDEVKIEVAANEKGHLFAKIGKVDVAKMTGIPDDLIILDEPIKEIGEHLVSVKVGEKEKKIKLLVTAA